MWAKTVIPTDLLAGKGYDGEQVRDGIILANDLAVCDPYRAATHNKGIMNGVDAAALRLDARLREGGVRRDHRCHVRCRASVRDALVEELSIPASEIPAFLVRLQRSGFFSVPGMEVSEDDSLETTTDKLAGLGELTPRYYRLRDLVGALA